MAKKPASETENSEPVGEGVITYGESEGEQVQSFLQNLANLNAIMSLTISGIITQNADGAITWRAGHLEHIANLYAGDPVTTERNYADDLAVARAYSAETWAALLEASK